MELWRRVANPWGQDVLVGVSWDLMWAAAIGAALFLVAHALWIRTRTADAHTEASAGDVPSGVPERIQRHALSSRVFHWAMGVTATEGSENRVG